MWGSPRGCSTCGSGAAGRGLGKQAIRDSGLAECLVYTQGVLAPAYRASQTFYGQSMWGLILLMGLTGGVPLSELPGGAPVASADTGVL